MMERLTERDANCADPKEIYGVHVKNHDYISAANRLADYEDTERTPEEVTALGKLFDYALKESKTLTEQLALLNRIRDLAEADRDGRLVVRCANCKHRMLDVIYGPVCNHSYGLRKIFHDSYCPYGEYQTNAGGGADG